MNDNPIKFHNKNAAESMNQSSDLVLEIEGKINDNQMECYINNINNNYISAFDVKKEQVIGKAVSSLEDGFTSVYYQVANWFFNNPSEDSLRLYVNINDHAIETIPIEDLMMEQYNLWEIVCYVLSRDKNDIKLFILLKDFNKELNLIKERLNIKDIKSYDDIIMNLSVIISNLSHAWRQPLNSLNFSILNFVDELEDEKHDSQVSQEFYKEIWEIIKNLSGEIEKFKAFFEMDYKMNLFDVNQYLNLVFEILEEKIIRENIVISVQTNEEIYRYGSVNEFLQIMYCVLFDLIEHCKETFDVKNRKINIQLTRSVDQIVIDILPMYDLNQYPNHQLSLNHLSMFQNIIHRKMKGNIDILNEEENKRISITIPLKCKEE